MKKHWRRNMRHTSLEKLSKFKVAQSINGIFHPWQKLAIYKTVHNAKLH